MAISAACTPPRPLAAATAVRFDRRSAALLLLSAAAPALTAPPANAASIGLFGIRKKLERAEEAVKEAVIVAEKEAGEVAGEGLQLVAGVELAGDAGDAAMVAGAEALGVVVGLSVVNGILKPEA